MRPDRPPGRNSEAGPNARPDRLQTPARANGQRSTPIVARGGDRAALLALSHERDLHLARRHAWWREGYRLGAEDGYRQGYERACADMEAAWREAARPVARGGASHAELERRRWTVFGEQRTRETFGLPHPADRRPGREAKP
jgi:hypothetical protein